MDKTKINSSDMFWTIAFIICKEILEDQMLSAVNEYRATNGKSKLRVNTKLGEAAQKQADHMRNNQKMSHEGPKEGATFDIRIKNAGYKWVNAAENVAQDNGDNWGTTLQMWINSPKHNANILGDFKDTGIASSLSSDNNKRYWVQVFGTSLESRINDGDKKTKDEPDDILASLAEAEEKPLKDDKHMPETNGEKIHLNPGKEKSQKIREVNKLDDDDGIAKNPGAEVKSQNIKSKLNEIKKSDSDPKHQNDKSNKEHKSSKELDDANKSNKKQMPFYGTNMDEDSHTCFHGLDDCKKHKDNDHPQEQDDVAKVAECNGLSHNFASKGHEKKSLFDRSNKNQKKADTLLARAILQLIKANRKMLTCK